jgi:hypothetical protein
MRINIQEFQFVAAYRQGNREFIIAAKSIDELKTEWERIPGNTLQLDLERVGVVTFGTFEPFKK